MDFESKNIGAIPIHSINNIKYNMRYNYFKTLIRLHLNNKNSSQRLLLRILIFCDKKKQTKKQITIYSLFNHLQQGIIKKSPIIVTYINSYIIAFLNLLKKTGFIRSYYLVPGKLIKPFLQYGYKPFIHEHIAVIYLHNNQIKLENALTITFISKPKRQIFITYKKLIALSKTQQGSTIILINTVFGLITHTEALQKQIGGQLLCRIK